MQQFRSLTRQHFRKLILTGPWWISVAALLLIARPGERFGAVRRLIELWRQQRQSSFLMIQPSGEADEH